jgi:phenylalanyl-tRNA synthetase beta chain
LSDAVTFAPITNASYLHPGKAAALMLRGKEAGVLGELHPQLLESYKFRQPVYLFELNVEMLYKAVKQASGQAEVKTVSPYPAVDRDMAFLAPDTVSHQQVLEALCSVEEPLLRRVDLFDVYRSEKLGADKRSLAYRLTFQSDETTMTDADVDARLGKLKDTLTQKLPIQFR